MCAGLIEGGCAPRGPLSVLKFGSSLLRDADGFRVASEEVGREVARGRRVLAVVSAMSGATDRLLGTAVALCEPPAALLASLLETGEDASVALLGIALTSRGLLTQTVSAGALDLRTTGSLHDADPVGVDAPRLVSWLSTHEVVVVPGFIGRDRAGSPSLLGRGGSDLTALFLAEELGAREVRLVKDVDGVHRTDPKLDPRRSAPLERASWSQVGRIGNGVVQDKALQYAERFGIRFRVAAPGGCGTFVGPEAAR